MSRDPDCFLIYKNIENERYTAYTTNLKLCDPSGVSGAVLRACLHVRGTAPGTVDDAQLIGGSQSEPAAERIL